MPATIQHMLAGSNTQQFLNLSILQTRLRWASATPNASMAFHPLVPMLIDAPSSLRVSAFSSTVTGIPTCMCVWAHAQLWGSHCMIPFNAQSAKNEKATL